MANQKRAHAIITGRVQGVCFRMETRRALADLKLSGWVRNKRDGSVEAVFEGPEADIETALAWCRKGPPLANVNRVNIRWGPYTGAYRSFEVVYANPEA